MILPAITPSASNSSQKPPQKLKFKGGNDEVKRVLDAARDKFGQSEMRQQLFPNAPKPAKNRPGSVTPPGNDFMSMFEGAAKAFNASRSSLANQAPMTPSRVDSGLGDDPFVSNTSFAKHQLIGASSRIDSGLGEMNDFNQSFASMRNTPSPKAQQFQVASSPDEDFSMFFEMPSSKVGSHTSSPHRSPILATQDVVMGSPSQLELDTSNSSEVLKGVNTPFARKQGSRSASMQGLMSDPQFSPPPFKMEPPPSGFQRGTPAPTDFSMPAVSQLGIHSTAGSQAFPVDLTKKKNQFTLLLRDMNASLPDDGTLGTKRDKARLERNAIRVEQGRRSISPELLEILDDQKLDLEEQKAGKSQRELRRIDRSVAELEKLRSHLSGLIKGKGKRTLLEANSSSPESSRPVSIEADGKLDVRQSIEKSETEDGPLLKRQKRSQAKFELGPTPEVEKILQKKVNDAIKEKKDNKKVIRPLRNNLAAHKSRRRAQEYTAYLERELGIKQESPGLADVIEANHSPSPASLRAASINPQEKGDSRTSASDSKPKRQNPRRKKGVQTSPLPAKETFIIKLQIPSWKANQSRKRNNAPFSNPSISTGSGVKDEHERPQGARGLDTDVVAQLLATNENPQYQPGRGAKHLRNALMQPLLPKAPIDEIKKPDEKISESPESDSDMSSSSSVDQTPSPRAEASSSVRKNKPGYVRPIHKRVPYNGKTYRGEFEANRAKRHDLRRAELEQKGYWDDDKKEEEHRADSPMKPTQKERRVGDFTLMVRYGQPDAQGRYRHDYLSKEGVQTTLNGTRIKRSRKNKKKK